MRGFAEASDPTSEMKAKNESESRSVWPVSMKILRTLPQELTLDKDGATHSVDNVHSTTASSLSKKNSKCLPQFTKVSKKDFKRIRDLGSGSYGVVTLVNLHGYHFALKQVNKAKVLAVDKVNNVHCERDVL